MNKLIYIMGKSSSGKDTIYKRVLEELHLRPLVLYTTRPMRENEQDGREYHFVDRDRFMEMKSAGSVIEERHYDTVLGEWIYFTARESVELDVNSLGIGTPESYVKLRDYLGEERIVPIYIEVEDGIRLARAVDRERHESEPKYAELCRRFLADSVDFSEEKLMEAGIKKRFSNNSDPESCIREVTEYIIKNLS